MFVLHIRDLLPCFIGIIVDLRLFIRLITLVHVALNMAFVMLFILVLFVRFLTLLILLILLIHILVLLVALLRLLWFVFLLVHKLILDG
jgi:hypothetical protein